MQQIQQNTSIDNFKSKQLPQTLNNKTQQTSQTNQTAAQSQAKHNTQKYNSKLQIRKILPYTNLKQSITNTNYSKILNYESQTQHPSTHCN